MATIIANKPKNEKIVFANFGALPRINKLNINKIKIKFPGTIKNQRVFDKTKKMFDPRDKLLSANVSVAHKKEKITKQSIPSHLNIIHLKPRNLMFTATFYSN
jgi:hypothetical protein